MTLHGYSEARAADAHTALDKDFGFIEKYVRSLGARVPGAGAIPSRLDAPLAEIQEVANDLHELVDKTTERTESSAPAADGAQW